jgi:hypothetical protein
MAKKRKRPANRPNRQPVRNDAAAKRQSAIDGFINSLAYLGEASPLTRANDFERHSITRDIETLTVMYRENWLAKRIIDTPCEDMTRSWYSVSSEIEQDKLDELAKLEAKHNVKQEITNGLRWARLYGGAAAVIVIKGQEDMLDEPLDFDTLTPGCFRGLIIVDRTNGLYPSMELEEDMDDPEFGYPKYYDVILDNTSSETLRIHHSRLLRFTGRMLPIQEEINEEYWGASELEHVYEELQKRNATSANIAQLVFQANVSALKVGDFGQAIAMGTDKMKEKVLTAIENMNRIKNSFGLLLMGNEDNYEQHPYSFAGISEVYESFMMDMAGAAEIPATKLFGRSPQGMNATGESDMKNYYEMLAQLQERQLRPAIEKLLPIMAVSLWGKIPEDMEVVFEPLMTTTPDQRAEIMSKQATSIIQAYSAGLISQKTALLELQEQGKSIGAWTNITDEDIENAEEEIDNGEEMEDPMGMMGPGGPGMPGGGEQMPLQGGPQPPEPPKPEAPQPEAPEAPEQGEQRMEKIHELKERVHNLREKQEETDDSDETERIRNLKERVHRLIVKGQKEDEVTELRSQIEKAVENGDIVAARAAIAEYRKAHGIEDKPLVDEKRKETLIDRIKGLFRGKDWNESDHPRGQPGNAGQFAPKGGGTSSGSSGESSSEGVANSPKTDYNKGKSNFAKTVAKKFRETFHAAKDAVAKERPEAAWRVDSSYTDDDYEHMDCYTTPGGSAVAVHDGDIVSVCKHPGDKAVRGSDLLAHARAQGGNKLDAFGGLYGFYIRNGFEPVSWCPFADVKGIRPDDWVRGRDHKEPVIFFKYTGRSYDEISKQYGERKSQFVRRVKKSDDYFAAQKARDDSMNGG